MFSHSLSSRNIDVRIQRAELEYQLEKEELNILNVELEAKGIEKRLHDSTRAASILNVLPNIEEHNNHDKSGEKSGRSSASSGVSSSSISTTTSAMRTFGNLFAGAQLPLDDAVNHQHHCLALVRVTIRYHRRYHRI
jgi:hypothetical protein